MVDFSSFVGYLTLALQDEDGADADAAKPARTGRSARSASAAAAAAADGDGDEVMRHMTSRTSVHHTSVSPCFPLTMCYCRS